MLEKKGILLDHQFLKNETQLYLHCINKFLTLHKSVFYDAVKLLFEIQQILYHTFIFFRIKNNACSLFLKKKKKKKKKNGKRIKQFLIECEKSKLKVTTMANQSKACHHY